MRTVPVEGGLRTAVHALAAGLDTMLSVWPDESDVEWPVHESGTRLARGIADAVASAPGAPPHDALEDEAREHFGRVMKLAAEYGEEPFRLDAYEPDTDSMGYASHALREQALEHHTAELLAATDNTTGALLLVTGPVSVQQAHVWLSGTLYEKVESWVAEDPLMWMERIAARWWLGRWRAPRPLPGDDFAHGVREQEFSLVERPLRCLGESPLEHLVAEGRLGRIGARQQHVAAQLLRSQAGVWTVASRDDDRAVFVAPLGGERHEVREHAPMDGTPYGAGFIAVGRLIPFGDGTWLRSPGTFLLSYGDSSAAMAHQLAEGMRSHAGQMPMPAMMEAAVHTLYGVRGLPRAVPPTASPDDAAEVGRELMRLMREAGIATLAEPNSNMARRWSRGSGNVVYEYDVDIVLAEYIDAVFKQSLNSREVRDARRRQARKQKKKGKGRR